MEVRPNVGSFLGRGRIGRDLKKILEKKIPFFYNPINPEKMKLFSLHASVF